MYSRLTGSGRSEGLSIGIELPDEERFYGGFKFDEYKVSKLTTKNQKTGKTTVLYRMKREVK